MAKLILKSLVYGFIFGILFFFLAPLGLQIRFIEQIKPILIPGLYLLRNITENNDIVPSFNSWISVVGLNVLIYSLVCFVIMYLRKASKKQR